MDLPRSPKTAEVYKARILREHRSVTRSSRVFAHEARRCCCCCCCFVGGHALSRSSCVLSVELLRRAPYAPAASRRAATRRETWHRFSNAHFNRTELRDLGSFASMLAHRNVNLFCVFHSSKGTYVVKSCELKKRRYYFIIPKRNRIIQ